MLKHILDYLFPKQPFPIRKQKKFMTFDEYENLSQRQKVTLHSRFHIHLVPEIIIESEDDYTLDGTV